jgi:hypothetical protein
MYIFILDLMSNRIYKYVYGMLLKYLPLAFYNMLFGTTIFTLQLRFTFLAKFLITKI